MTGLEYEPKLAVNFEQRFRLIVILTAENSERSIQLANFSANKTRVLYVCSERFNTSQFKNINIECYYFNDNFKKPDSLTYQYNSFILAKKIGSILKKYKIADCDMLFILNNLGYAGILEYYKEAKAHFDCFKLLDEMEIIHSYNNHIYTTIRSYTASTMEIKQQLDKFFKPVFRIPDGVDKPDLVLPATDRVKNKEMLLGCYCPEINHFDYDIAKEIALKFPEHSFLYIFPEAHPFLKEKNDLKNLQFKSLKAMNTNFNLVILPVAATDTNTLNKYFYSNLIFNRPIYALKNQDLLLNKEFVKLFDSKEDLIDAITCYEGMSIKNTLTHKFLYDNSSWNSRLKHLESIILAYIGY